MLKLLFGIQFCFLVNSISFGQFLNDSVLVTPKSEWLFKISPLSVFETDGGIGLSVEYLIPQKKIGFQLEMQPLLFSVAKNGYKFDQPKGTEALSRLSGIKLRPEVRFYLKGLHSKPYNEPVILDFKGKPVKRVESIRVFVSVDFLYKNVKAERVNNFFIRSDRGQYINPVKATYTDVKKVYGFDFKIGSVSQSFPNPKFWVEAFIGIGGRIKSFSYRNIPKGAILPDRFIKLFLYRDTFSSSNTTLFRISIPAGVKLIYKLH